MFTKDEKYREWGVQQLSKLEQLKREKDVERLSITDCGPDAYANPYGCQGWADPCGDGDIISLSMCGASKLLDTLDWRGTDVCRDVFQYLTWVGPSELAGTNGAVPAGVPPTPKGVIEGCCDPRPGIAWGDMCKYEVNGFAHLGRSGGLTCMYEDSLKQCETSPLVRFNGTLIRSNFEWRAAMAADVILQDAQWMVIYGDRSKPGQVDGLEKLIGTGATSYDGKRCPGLDGGVITWNGGCFATADSVWEDGRTESCGPITIPEGTSYITLLKWIVANQNARISMTGNLRSQGLRPGDRYLAVNPMDAMCLLDCMTCYRMCDADCNVHVTIESTKAQEFRDSLMGGFFGDGQLKLDGGMLPLLADPTIPQGTHYLMIPRVGNRRMIFGEYQDMNSVDRPDTTRFQVSDGGRFMHYQQNKETCFEHVVDHRMRLQAPGRYLQFKITGFTCELPNVIPSCKSTCAPLVVNPVAPVAP